MQLPPLKISACSFNYFSVVFLLLVLHYPIQVYFIHVYNYMKYCTCCILIITVLSDFQP